MNEYMEMYIAEAKELLDEMNGSLLKLDKNIGDTSLINSIFRDIHTIKGNSASMGFKKMESLSHSMEDVLQDIREGKVEIDEKIMELLFVCHDYLESGINTVMQTGNEEEMKIEGILGKLHLIIGEKHERINSKVDKPLNQSLDHIDLMLNTKDLCSLKQYTDMEWKAYLIKIQVSSDCIFKTVRVWMWFQEIGEYLKIIKSDPIVPTTDKIKNNEFSFDGSEVKLLAVSKEDTGKLLGKLNTLLDMEKVYIEAVRLKDTDFLKSQIKLVMSNAAELSKDTRELSPEQAENVDKDRLIEIKSVFSGDFLTEITQQLSKMDTELQKLKEKPDSNNTIYKLSRLFHTVKGIAGFIDNKPIVRITDTAENLVEYYRKENNGAKGVKSELFERSVVLIRKLCEEDRAEVGKETASQADQLIADMEKELPVKEETPEKEEPETVDGLRSRTEQTVKTQGTSLENSFMRISTQKIDLLVDMLGELIIMHSLILKESSEHFDSNDKYMNNLLRMSKIIKEIQNLSMSLRMVSLKQTLQKTMRVGRDTAVELGKKADIEITGEETEIDRNIADKLVDPLMHLIRNSISHGIEDTKERVKKGKPETGLVNIRAYSKRGYVYIEVEDDGQGLNLEKIRAKALENKLMEPNVNYSNEEIMKLIFLPGFSTNEVIDNVSGRGVGMNVVETEIKKVGGKIDIINKPGEGCTFIMKIPLNLAVMNGTIVDIFGSRYIIPTIYIKQFMKPEETQWVKVKNKKTMLHVRDEIIQVIPTWKVFGMEELPDGEDENMVIIIEVEQKLKALPVRNIIGRQEIVAKPLEKEIGGVDFISGASILGDGKVSLILDVESIFEINY